LVLALFGWEVGVLAEGGSAFATGFGVMALAGASASLYYMYRCYRIKARPFWNHWQVATDFGGHALALGSALVGSAGLILALAQGSGYGLLLPLAAGGVLLGQTLHAIGLRAHAHAMTGQEHEGAVSHYIQTTTFGLTYIARNVTLGVNMMVALASMLLAANLWISVGLWTLLLLGLLATSVIGRALFYVLVVPTTMPGAFFWKNKGFEQHARDIGLAAMPQVGVVMHTH
jgi:hypothetical protein